MRFATVPATFATLLRSPPFQDMSLYHKFNILSEAMLLIRTGRDPTKRCDGLGWGNAEFPKRRDIFCSIVGIASD